MSPGIRESAPQGSPIDMRAQEVGRSENRTVIVRIPVLPEHESALTSDWCSSQESLENRQHEEKQMTAMATTALAGAASSSLTWDSINWKTVESEVRRLQMRIAKAVRESRHGKVKTLQWLLTHSLHAKLFAVKRVVENPGSKTPGVDKIIWKTPQQKLKAAQSLKRRGYQTLPLRRIYIPKKNGQKRPLSIPVMKCRATQALYLLALEPISEQLADESSFGFRPKRSCADALEKCYVMLARKGSAQYIFEGDIKSCFDRISHQWLRDNIPMDKEILNKWLAAGFIENGILYPTNSGTPQGGPISPALLNLTLRGLEKAVIPERPKDKRTDKIHIAVYADDFVITGSSREVLEEKVKPAAENFLKERGLELSKDKSRITHISEGFDFLGINVRKYDGKYISKPSKSSVKSFMANIRETIKSHPTAKTENLIRMLNPKIRGWANYLCHSSASKTFGLVDHLIYQALQRWTHRRHPRKSAGWRNRKYFRQCDLKNWTFSAKIKTGKDRGKYIDLFRASSVSIKRHIMVRGSAHPYDPQFKEYFKDRWKIARGSRRVSTIQDPLT